MQFAVPPSETSVPPPARPDGACNSIVIYRLAVEDGCPSPGQRAVITVCEEVLLLTFDYDTGRPSTWLSERSLRTALGGALLMDLALADRIDADFDGLFVVDLARPGNSFSTTRSRASSTTENGARSIAGSACSRRTTSPCGQC